MNMMPIVEYLESQGLGEQGRTIFINAFPSNVDEGIMLRPRLVGAGIDHELPGYLKFEFSAICRSTNFVAAETLSRAVAKSLRLHETTLGDWTVNYIRPMHVPVPYPLSPGENIESNVRFEACVVDPEWA